MVRRKPLRHLTLCHTVASGVKKTQLRNSTQIFPFVTIGKKNTGIVIELLSKNKPSLKELKQFSHVQILWWFSKFEDDRSRETVHFDLVSYFF
jgi:tRNA (Thr-GGU) A37 N-methylase